MKIKNKNAMTLVEMMIAIAILIIGIGGFTMLFTKTWQNNSYTIEMGQSSLAVSQGVNKMVGYLRGVRQGDDGSYPIQSANDNDLVVFSDYDKDGITERLHFYKNNQAILMGVRKPTNGIPKTYPSGDQTTVTLAGHIVNDPGFPIFYYYNENYPGDLANNPMATPAAIADVRLIKIYLHINIDPNRPPDNIQMQSFVELRNLNDYDTVK